ncbi:hypothetical protein OLMES_3607 [Oleiphilus messinensis]|uniref:Uncharacterized protein n=1 Tax=Oleiphilus messinensis TaxID=141451 RepID=A0A1Y0IE28_9GAMM|nr:hypothetical protein OLMES_3607 [Oleiphilus messinensis]
MPTIQAMIAMLLPIDFVLCSVDGSVTYLSPVFQFARVKLKVLRRYVVISIKDAPE